VGYVPLVSSESQGQAEWTMPAGSKLHLTSVKRSPSGHHVIKAKVVSEPVEAKSTTARSETAGSTGAGTVAQPTTAQPAAAEVKSTTQASPVGRATPLTIKEVQDHMAKIPNANKIPQITQLMETHHGESGLVHPPNHGMSHAEDMHHLEIEGIKFHYPPTDQGRRAAANTIIALMSGARKIPAPLWRAQTDLIHSSQRNNQDPYWGRKYNEPGWRREDRCVRPRARCS
jgi:hypothetical protein